MHTKFSVAYNIIIEQLFCASYSKQLMATENASTLCNVTQDSSMVRHPPLSRAAPRPMISVTKKLHLLRYNFKIFRSKGALIALLLCSCALFVYNFLIIFSCFISPPLDLHSLMAILLLIWASFCTQCFCSGSDYE